MLTKQQVLEAYGDLQLLHAYGEDNPHRYVFIGTASDGAQIQVIHSSNMYIWEDYIRREKPVTLNVEPVYHAIQVMRNGKLLFEDHQSVSY